MEHRFANHPYLRSWNIHVLQHLFLLSSMCEWIMQQVIIRIDLYSVFGLSNRIFWKVYVNFMIMKYTHDDIDALFGRWSMAFNKESFPTLPLLMKSFMDVEAVPTIPHLIGEVPDFKKFIEEGIGVKENALLGHAKAQKFNFYVKASGCSVMKYKLLCTNDD